MNGLIPLYGADLDLVDWVAPQRAARLVSLDLVQAIRSRTGDIKRLIFRRRPSDGRPNQPADYLGTRYSFREHLDDGHLCCRLKRLGGGESDEAEDVPAPPAQAATRLSDLLLIGPHRALRGDCRDFRGLRRCSTKTLSRSCTRVRPPDGLRERCRFFHKADMSVRSRRILV